MKIIGALARGNSAPTIYFCEYCHSEIEKEGIQALLTNTQYKDDVYGDTIRVLAVECSEDGKSEEETKQILLKNLRLVGLIFEAHDSSEYKSIVLDKYVDLDIYLNEIVDY